MTREEAIDILKCDISADKEGIEYCHDEVGIEALEMAIKALEQEPTPNDDYFRKMAGVVISQLRTDRDRLEDKLAKLEKEPKKTGHWVIGRIFPTKMADENLIEYRCSECDRAIRCTESQLVNYPYCHCGAKMVEPQESEDKE